MGGGRLEVHTIIITLIKAPQECKVSAVCIHLHYIAPKCVTMPHNKLNLEEESDFIHHRLFFLSDEVNEAVVLVVMCRGGYSMA